MERASKIIYTLLFVVALFLLGCPCLFDVTIDSPLDGEHYEVGEEISFSSSVGQSAESLVWTSSIDGQIGTLERLMFAMLAEY